MGTPWSRTPRFVLSLAARAETAIASSMEDVQRYVCLYNKFSSDHKNRQFRENCWTKLGEKFNMTAKQAESNTRTFDQPTDECHHFELSCGGRNIPFAPSNDYLETKKRKGRLNHLPGKIRGVFVI